MYCHIGAPWTAGKAVCPVITLSRSPDHTAHISGAPANSAHSRTESGLPSCSVAPSGVIAKRPSAVSLNTPRPVSILSKRCSDEPMRSSRRSQFVHGLRSAGDEIGDAKGRGHVQRLHRQERIEHLQHLGRGLCRGGAAVEDIGLPP